MNAMGVEARVGDGVVEIVEEMSLVGQTVDGADGEQRAEMLGGGGL